MKNNKTDGALVSIEKKLQLRVPLAFHKLCEGFDKIYKEDGEEAMMKAIGTFAEGMNDPEGRTMKG